MGWIGERGISRKRMGTCRVTIITELSELRPQKHYAGRNLTLADAFQISSALATGCEAFLTNDIGIKGISDLNVIVLSEM